MHIIIDNFSITRNMLIERDVTSGVLSSVILEYFAIAGGYKNSG